MKRNIRYSLHADILVSSFSSGRGYGTVVIRKVVSEGDFMYQVRVFGSRSYIKQQGSDARVSESVQSLPVMSNQIPMDSSKACQPMDPDKNGGK